MGGKMKEALKPWYAIATPHKDIRDGHLEESVFAANIWAVVQDSAPEVYLDPEEFFKKSYMTEGLKTVLSRVSDALSGKADSGDRIISLQTAFGGGKTHTLVALWHLAKYSKELSESSLSDDLKSLLNTPENGQARKVAVFTNSTCDPTQGRNTESGFNTKTIWGDLAYQLGGKELYQLVKDNDDSRIVPQGIFAEILRKASPCLILLDELADYCVGASAVDIGSSTLADQTISFIQQLTEAVQQVPGSVVVATLPASKYEVAQSEKGQEIFITLEKRFHRLGADIKPVSDEEIYEVVRARLFESVAIKKESKYPSKIAAAFHKMYKNHSDEVPKEATKSSYKKQIERSYPFHPMLIDTLYTRWGSHPDFQRTRGVLRLMASIVGDLWKKRENNTQSQPLIQPCHVNWSLDPMQAILTRLWGNTYQSVAAADVIGYKSNAGTLDSERGAEYENQAIGKGIASAIMLGSFGGKTDKSGYSSKDIKLACSRPGINWSYSDGALIELDNRCFYLHTASAGNLGKRYWFGTKPTLNKLVIQYRQQIEKDDFTNEIVESLKDQIRTSSKSDATWRIVVDPSQDLPEQKSLALLILPPSLAWNDSEEQKKKVEEFILDISNHCGNQNRQYRNTLLFLAPQSRMLSSINRAYKEIAALEGVKYDYWDQLDKQQKEELETRLNETKRKALENLGSAYTAVFRVQGNEVVSCLLPDVRDNFGEHLNYLWTTLVEDTEWIIRKVGLVTLEKSGLIPKEGGISLRDAIDSFLKFTDKHMISSKKAVTEGLAQACSSEKIGIGYGITPSELKAKHCGESVSLDPSEDHVWVIPSFIKEEESENETEKEQEDKKRNVEDEESTESEKIVKQLSIKGTVPLENYYNLFTCFINPSREIGFQINIGIDFEMTNKQGKKISIENKKLKAIIESAKQLGLSCNIEESKKS